MTNLLDETRGIMARHGKSENDVRWVGSRDGAYSLPWRLFAQLAESANYNNGYGGQEVVTDIVVVGDDWWLERHEYDGSEWWEYKSLPKQTARYRPFTHVVSGSWHSIDDAETAEGIDP